VTAARPSLRYAQRRPVAPLRALIECLWTITGPPASSPRAPERIVPDGCPELIVHLGDPFARLVGGRWVVQPRAFLAGTLSRPWLLRAGRRVDTIGVRFRAGRTTAVLALSMAEASDREIPLATIVGRRAGSALLRSVRAAATRASRLSAIERWLEERLAEQQSRHSTAAPAVDRIRDARGQARVEDIARALGWTRRRLERAFAHDLGIGPKAYARIVRLNAVLATLEDDERPRAVDLALASGYFDQAHLLRDFRLLAGRTPAKGRESDGAMARHFTDPRRLRALLAGE
jgi:methylphosphotriester-DNA--protein-cysteine methyltransferase